jgi:hypothetical protein
VSRIEAALALIGGVLDESGIDGNALADGNGRIVGHCRCSLSRDTATARFRFGALEYKKRTIRLARRPAVTFAKNAKGRTTHVTTRSRTK